MLDSRSHLYPDTERAMGWDVGATGLQIVLGAEVPDLVAQYLGDDVARLPRATTGSRCDDIAGWVCHPGGPKVLEAIEAALDLPADALEVTWQLAGRDRQPVVGLGAARAARHPARPARRRPGTPGLLLAMGPGFCSELVLLRW